jgi:hypothetical protein
MAASGRIGRTAIAVALSELPNSVGSGATSEPATAVAPRATRATELIVVSKDGPNADLTRAVGPNGLVRTQVVRSAVGRSGPARNALVRRAVGRRGAARNGLVRRVFVRSGASRSGPARGALVRRAVGRSAAGRSGVARNALVRRAVGRSAAGRSGPARNRARPARAARTAGRIGRGVMTARPDLTEWAGTGGRPANRRVLGSARQVAPAMRGTPVRGDVPRARTRERAVPVGWLPQHLRYRRR